jgi:hypothetical protein
MTEIRDIEPDPETAIITPDEIDFIYQKTDSGDDVVGLLIDDPLLGSLFVALSTEQATDIATNLGGMVANIEQVRAEWFRRHPG